MATEIPKSGFDMNIMPSRPDFPWRVRNWNNFCCVVEDAYGRFGHFNGIPSFFHRLQAVS